MMNLKEVEIKIEVFDLQVDLIKNSNELD